LKHVDTIVLVEDIEKSKKFYTDVIGLEILHDWGSMVVFKERFAIHKANALLPETEIQKYIAQGQQGRNNIVIYFEAEDLESEFRKITDKGIKIIHGIIELPWQKIFRIYDPDNHIIEIGNPF
jgi:predicted enzyme related to lactoylglutathione lyase